MPDRDLVKSYGEELAACMRSKTTVKRHANVLQHAMGYFKKILEPIEKQELLTAIEDYRLGMLPLVGPGTLVNVRTDGHLYSTIRQGRRRMPAYQRIPEMDRWDIVNYLRYLNGQKGVAAK